jgi:F-type H+-transporting ATPase subunit delta
MANKNATVVKRYSRALWLLGRSVDEAEGWVDSLAKVSSLIDSSKDLQSLLFSPAFTAEQKTKVFSSVLEAQGTPEQLAKFLQAVLRAGRITALAEISEGYRQKILEARNAVEAVVETAFPLSEASEKKLVSHLEKIVGKKLVVKVKVQPDLLAGLRVHVGGKTLDFSFTAQLNKLERWLDRAQA